MGEHFRKEVPASDNVSSSTMPFFCSVDEGGERRNETVRGGELEMNADGVSSLLAVLRRKSLNSIIGWRQGRRGMTV